jgi:hypothetical protein
MSGSSSILVVNFNLLTLPGIRVWELKAARNRTTTRMNTGWTRDFDIGLDQTGLDETRLSLLHEMGMALSLDSSVWLLLVCIAGFLLPLIWIWISNLDFWDCKCNICQPSF